MMMMMMVVVDDDDDDDNDDDDDELSVCVPATRHKSKTTNHIINGRSAAN